MCFFWWGEAARNFPSLISLIIHATLYDQFKYSTASQNQIFTKKTNLYLFYFHEEITRRGNGRVRNGRVLSWLSCRRNRRIAITIQQTITPPVCKYSTALDCVMRTTRGTTREKCRAYDKTNNKKTKK